MKRCLVEYDFVIKKYCGDIEKLVNVLSYVIDFIVDCYVGRCGRICVDYFFVCKGYSEKCWSKEYFLFYVRIFYFIKEDEDIIRGFVSYRFNRNIFIIIRYGINI